MSDPPPVDLRAFALVAVLLAGCAGTSKHTTTSTASRPFDARRTVDAFLYTPARPAAVCPRLWTADAQPECARLLARLKQARRRHVFAPPQRGTMMYRLAGVSGDTVTIEAGDRQPDPARGAPTFYGSFELRRTGALWKIARFEP